MKYNVYICGGGSEFVASEISPKIGKYAWKEFEFDGSAYMQKLKDGEIPEEFRIVPDVNEFSCADGFFTSSNRPFWQEGNRIVVVDEGENQVDEIPFGAANVENTTELSPADKPYFVYELEEKGTWCVIIETDSPFDRAKLKVLSRKFVCFDGELVREFVKGVEYDGVFYDDFDGDQDIDGEDLMFADESGVVVTEEA